MNTREKFSEEKLDFFRTKMDENMLKPGPLMPTLHDAQHIFGYIPLEIQKIISEKLGISVAKINGVVTFYSNFSIEPKGKHEIHVCLGTACYVRGSKTIMEALENHYHIKDGETTKDGEITLCSTRCIGACGLAPVFSVDGHIYGTANIVKTNEVIKALEDKENEDS
ncbi:MAG: NAD(P)H-dependent oxidoreductase subunit E [Acholeplasmataceae bacterium]